MKKILQLFKLIGPGVITGASDDDPTAIATYSQGGAQFGYHQLWTSLFVLPLMIVVQEMSGRIGMVTGKGIAYVLKHNFAKWLVFIIITLLTIANVINIGADLGAVADSMRLIIPLPFFLLLISFAILVTLMEVFIPFSLYQNILKYITLSLLSYIISSLLIKQNWVEIITNTVVPYMSFHKAFLLNLVAILGGNISPYLFFWQASEEVEEEVKVGKIKKIDTLKKPRVTKKEIGRMKIDTIIGMVFSVTIIFFIEIAVASTIGIHGGGIITTPAQAAEALKPFAGNFAFLLFVLGILGSGLLAIPALAGSTAFAISEIFSWKAGLNRNIMEVPLFYATIAGATLLGVLINILPIKPFVMLVYSAAINGFITPILLVFILLIANNKKLMRKRRNNLFSNIIGVTVTLLMGIAALVLAYSLLF